MLSAIDQTPIPSTLTDQQRVFFHAVLDLLFVSQAVLLEHDLDQDEDKSFPDSIDKMIRVLRDLGVPVSSREEFRNRYVSRIFAQA